MSTRGKRGAAKQAAAATAATATTAAALAFVAHAGLSEETESGLLDSAPHDAADRSVFVVVKFAYFTFRLGSAATAAAIDFRRPESAVEAVLVYDDASGSGGGSGGGGGGGESAARSKRKPTKAKAGRGRGGGGGGGGGGGKRVRRTRGDDDDSQEDDDEDDDSAGEEGVATGAAAAAGDRQQPEEGPLDGGRFRAVDFVTQAPIEYSGEPSADGQTLTLTMRLRVLSSQHEDSMFRIRFGFRSAAVAPLFTRPVRVVSKPEQLAGSKKKRLLGGQADGGDEDGGGDGDEGDGGDAASGPMEALMRKHRLMVDASAAGEDNALLRKKKRSFAHAMVDALQRIEKMQAMQRSMMGDLMAAAATGGVGLGVDAATAAATAAAAMPAAVAPPAPSSLPPALPQPPADFGSYFERMVASFGRIPTEQRAGALRSAIATALMQGDDSIAELLDMMLGGSGGGGGGGGGGADGGDAPPTPGGETEDLWAPR